MKIKILLLLFCLCSLNVMAQSVREKLKFDDSWQFSLGYAGDPAKDFNSGTEYFNYLTKANSIHNDGLYVAILAPIK